ncbi:hypothetical protein AB0N81_19715 [Streptomyces sp. NPDC093510]|uniref:hypothetical protein n=1 Tax=Streptomyces sp. NPDC093510 TaxID=3155199 RepID=UPI00343D8720
MAVTTALTPGAANAADRHEVTLERTARLGAGGTKAAVAGTYTCEGYKGPVRLKVTVRTHRTRELDADEVEAVKGIYQWIGVGGLPVPKTATTSTSQERTLDGTCDGSARAHRWEHALSGEVTKDTRANVTVAMSSVDSRTAETTALAATSGEVTFS